MHKRLGAVAASLFLAACGSTPQISSPDAGPPPVVPLEPLAKIDGVGESAALAQLPLLGPFDAPSAEIDDDGFISTRMSVTLDPAATLDAVNAALVAANAKLSFARPGWPWMTLAIAAVESSTVAETRADEIRAIGPFVSVYPAFLPATLRTVPGSAAAQSSHLQLERFLQAWNFDGIATRKISVRCSDAFVQATAVPQMPGLTFHPSLVPFLGKDGNDDFRGNHGFWTTSILAATVDATPPTGTSPDPGRLIDLQCAQAGGPFPESMARLKEIIPATGPVVVSVSLAYAFEPASKLSLAKRAEEAMQWRLFLKDFGDRVIVFAGAGNFAQRREPSQAELSSPYTIQSRFENLEMLVPEADRASLAAIFRSARAQDPSFDRVRGQTLIVGAAKKDGGKLAESQLGDDVRMIGDKVLGSCPVPDGTCRDGFYDEAGTSASTPQAAGLAAYLLSMAPTVPMADLRATLIAAYDGRWIDAFNATLLLESIAPTVLVRDALLDVDTNLRFDEADIAQVLAAIDAREAAQPNPARATQDFLREDLNGDGFTRSDKAAVFDLTADRTPVHSVVPAASQLFGVPHRYDEQGVTDVDVLCFYAASASFDGDLDAARELLEGRCVSDEMVTGRWRGTYRARVTTLDDLVLSCVNGARGLSTSVHEGNYQIDCGEGEFGATPCTAISGMTVGTITETRPNGDHIVAGTLAAGSCSNGTCMGVCVSEGADRCHVPPELVCMTCAFPMVTQTTVQGTATLTAQALGRRPLMNFKAAPTGKYAFEAALQGASIRLQRDRVYTLIERGMCTQGERDSANALAMASTDFIDTGSFTLDGSIYDEATMERALFTGSSAGGTAAGSGSGTWVGAPATQMNSWSVEWSIQRMP